jgi:hypothetical protein
MERQEVQRLAPGNVIAWWGAHQFPIGWVEIVDSTIITPRKLTEAPSAEMVKVNILEAPADSPKRYVPGSTASGLELTETRWVGVYIDVTDLRYVPSSFDSREAWELARGAPGARLTREGWNDLNRGTDAIGDAYGAMKCTIGENGVRRFTVRSQTAGLAGLLPMGSTVVVEIDEAFLRGLGKHLRESETSDAPSALRELPEASEAPKGADIDAANWIADELGVSWLDDSRPGCFKVGIPDAALDDLESLLGGRADGVAVRPWPSETIVSIPFDVARRAYEERNGHR